MNLNDIRRVLGQIGIINIPQPNHSGWTHIPCPYAPFPWSGHRHGVDRSHGFAIKVEDQGISAYKCPVCKRHGRISSILRVMGLARGKDYEDQIRDADHCDMVASVLPDFENRAGMTNLDNVMPDPLDEDLYEGIFVDPTTVPEVHDYIAGRGVSDEAVAHIGIGWDKSRRRITFPIRGREGQLYGWSGRALRESQQPRVLDYEGLPKRHLILGEHDWKPGRPVVMVEGLFAYARFITEGVHEHANVGALLGSELTEGKETILKHWALPTYFFVDPDPAGDACLWGRIVPPAPGSDAPATRQPESGAIFRLSSEMPVFAPEYPHGIDDPDRLTLSHILYAIKNTSPAFAGAF